MWVPPPLRDTFWYCWRKKRILVLICTTCTWSSPINWAKGKRWNFIRLSKLSLILVLIFYFYEAVDTRIICSTYYASTSLSLLANHGDETQIPHKSWHNLTSNKWKTFSSILILYSDLIVTKWNNVANFYMLEFGNNFNWVSQIWFSILIFWLQNRIYLPFTYVLCSVKGAFCYVY